MASGYLTCMCGAYLYEMVSQDGEPNGHVCPDCVTFYDEDGTRLEGPYRPNETMAVSYKIRKSVKTTRKET